MIELVTHTQNGEPVYLIETPTITQVIIGRDEMLEATNVE